AVGRAGAVHVQALAAVHAQLTGAGGGPLLVGAAVAVPDVHLGAVGLGGAVDVQAPVRPDAPEGTRVVSRGLASGPGGGDHGLGCGRPGAVGDGDVVVHHVAAVAVGDVGAAVGRPVAGDGEVTHVLAVPVVGGGPGAGVRQDVVPDGVVPRALVEVDAEPAVGAQAVVVADHRARVPRERVDAAAVGHLLHDVVHIVADEPVAGGGGGRGVARLEVVQAAVGVVGAAARLVGSPAVPDRQAGVRQVVDLVVGHVGAGDVRGQDRDDAPVVQAEVVDAVVADGDVPVDHPLVARVVRLAAHAAGHDAAGRAVGDLRAGDRDVGGAQADP